MDRLLANTHIEKNLGFFYDDFYQNLLDMRAKAIREEMDWEVKSTMLQQCGWTTITLKTLGSNKNSVDIGEWMDRFCHGKCLRHGRSFLFEENSMAMLFKLRWA